MQYLFVNDQPMFVALEAMDSLVTELSNSELVDAPDVQEELEGQLLAIGNTRETIVTSGMSREVANTVNVAVEGFLSRYAIRDFTVEPSIEGSVCALEALSEKQGTVLQRVIAWLRERLSKAIEWLSGIFKRGGKGEAIIAKAKEMAENVDSERNGKNVADLIKDPKAAAQKSRIDPADEKSGTYEDFCEALEKQMEPLKHDMTQMYARANSNAVLRVAVTNVESIKSFYDHMEKTESAITGIRSVVDGVAAELRDIRNVQEAAQKINLARMAIYRELGGEDESVLGAIRQQQFTDKAGNELTADNVPYDELIKAVTTIAKNTMAANAEGRIRELTQLAKAVDTLGQINDSNAFKRLSESDRNMIMTALEGLSKDISRYQSASMENWNYVIQLYSGVGAFFNSELSIYYRAIAAIQRAATQVLSGNDRTAVFEGFKKQGFNVDLSEEDLQRRGVGTEHFSGDVLGDVRPMIALEDLGLEELPEFPFSNPVGFSTGLMAALEAEEQAAQGDTTTRFAKLREWISKLVEWFKTLFTRTRDSVKEKIEKAKEINKDQSEAIKSAKQSGAKIRPEVLETFKTYLTDSAFWTASGFSSSIEQRVKGNKPLAVALSKAAMTGVLPGFTTMITSLKEFMTQLGGVNSAKDLVDMASSPHLGKFIEGRETYEAALGKASDGLFKNAAEVGAVINDTRDYSDKLTDLLLQTMLPSDNYAEILSVVGNKLNSWNDSEVQSQDMQAAAAIFPEIKKVLQSYTAAEDFISSISLEILTVAILSRKQVVQAMFAAAKEKDPNAVMYDNQELILLSDLSLWGISGLGMESAVVALEALDVQMDAYAAFPYLALNAGLEDDQAAAPAGTGVFARIKAWLTRIFDWITNIFKRKQEDQSKQMEIAAEAAAKEEERVKVAEQAQPARDEIVKIFERYVKDHAWYKNSKVRVSQLTSISKFGMKMIYAPNGLQMYDDAFAAVMAEAQEILKSYEGVTTIEALSEVPATQISEPVRRFFQDTDFDGYSTLEEHAGAYLKIRSHSGTFTHNAAKVNGLMLKIRDAVKHLEQLADKAEASGVKPSDSANKALIKIHALLMYVDSANKATVKASLGILMGTGLDSEDAIKEIFADYAEKNPDSGISISQSDIEQLRLLPVWRDKRKA